MATYRRFATTPQPPLRRIRIGVGHTGWLLGRRSATENLQVGHGDRGFKEFDSEVLAETVKLKRDEMLAKIQSQDAATPKLDAA